MNKFIELIEQIEKEGFSRHLDAEIHSLITNQQLWNEVTPFYTYSIDAALALLPKGFEWSVSNRCPAPDKGRAYIHNGEMQFVGGGMARNPKYQGFEITAATPALALCIVCLLAHGANA